MSCNEIKRNLCSLCEDSDKLAHSRSLIRIIKDAFQIAKNAQFLHVDNEDADQTVRILIRMQRSSEWLGSFTFVHDRNDFF